MPKAINKTNNTVKILVSTKETHGQRKNDFCYAPEGEPVRFPFIPNRASDAARSLAGFYCHLATTTFKVTNTDMTREQYIDEYVKNFPYEKDTEMIELLKEEAGELLKLAEDFTEGSVFECKYYTFTLRQGEKVKL